MVERMINVKHKKQYEKVDIKKFSDLEKENYLTQIVKIEEDEIEWLDNSSVIYLWALFGENDSDAEFVCLQVGASIDGRDEIEKDIDKMRMIWSVLFLVREDP